MKGKNSQLIDSMPHILMFVRLVFKILLVYDCNVPYSPLNKSPSLLLLCCISPPTPRSSISLSVVWYTLILIPYYWMEVLCMRIFFFYKRPRFKRKEATTKKKQINLYTHVISQHFCIVQQQKKRQQFIPEDVLVLQ